jgi:NhaP-type Na+/H+ or K+/H+ antiporter
MTLASAGVAALLYWTMDVPLLVAVIGGVIISDTTPSVVLALLSQLRISDQTKTLLTLETAVSDVLVLVLTIALLETYEAGEFAVASFAGSLVLAILGAVLIGFLMGIIWANLLHRVRHLQNSMFVTVAAAFTLYSAIEMLGWSGFLAVLAFGITVGSAGAFSNYLASHHRFLLYVLHPLSLSRRERSFLGELVFLLHTFFFVYIGLSVRLSNLGIMALALLAVLLLAVLRFCAVWLSFSRDLPARDAAQAAVMVPKGLTSVVLAILLVQHGLPGASFIQDFTAAVILWSIVVTSILVFLVEKTAVGEWYARALRMFAFRGSERQSG